MNEQIIEAALKDGGIPAAQAAAYRLLLQHADRFSAMENLEKEEASGGRSAATPSPDATIEDHCRKLLAIAHEDEIAMEDPEFIASSDLVGMANYLNQLFKLSGAKSNKGDAPCNTGNVNFSGPAPESGLDPRVGELQIENSKLRERVEAQARQISHMFEMGDEADAKHAAQVASLTKERNEALCDRDKAQRNLAIQEKLVAYWKNVLVTSIDGEVAALTKERDEARYTRNATQAECNRLLGEKRLLEDELANYRADAVSQFRKPTPTPAAMVREFNCKFGVPIAYKPAFPARDRMDLRVRLIAEEFCEFLTACGYKFTINVSDAIGIFFKSTTSDRTDLIAAADGLADMQYVIEGTALEFGIPLAAVFAEVHRSNMTKTGRADDGGGTPAGKSMKGDGYEKPQVERILREHGLEG